MEDDNDDTDISVDFNDTDINVENVERRNPFIESDEQESDIDIGSQEFSSQVAIVEVEIEPEPQKKRKDRRHKGRTARHGKKAKRVGQDWKHHELVRKAKDEEAKDDGVPDLDPFDVDENPVNDGIQPDIELPDRSKSYFNQR